MAKYDKVYKVIGRGGEVLDITPEHYSMDDNYICVNSTRFDKDTLMRADDQGEYEYDITPHYRHLETNELVRYSDTAVRIEEFDESLLDYVEDYHIVWLDGCNQTLDFLIKQLNIGLVIHSALNLLFYY